jgi:Au+-exporting ATPase
MSTDTRSGTVLAITGMSCAACVHGVTAALSRVSGVTKVAVDLGTGRAVVEGSADAASLIAAVEKAGYDARLAGDETGKGMGHGRRGSY